MGAIHGDQGAVIYGSISSLNCITVVIFTPILTRLFSKLFSTNKCTLGIILLMTGYCLFLTNRGRIPAYYLAIFLFTLGEIMTTLVEGPYLSQRIPASHRGRINGLMTVSQSILQGAMSLFIGFTYDNISPQASWISVLSILLIALVLSRVLAAKDKQAYPALYKV